MQYDAADNLRKWIKKIHASYTLEGTDLENVESIKYLGVTITSDLRWNTRVSNVCTKANRTLGFLRRNLYSCPQEVKEAAYKGLVCPVLDYGSSAWDPPGIVLQELVGWLCWGLTSQSTIFQSYRDGAIASWVIYQYFRGVKCLAQGHNTAAVGLEPRTSRSRVRHSTTEPPRSPSSPGRIRKRAKVRCQICDR